MSHHYGIGVGGGSSFFDLVCDYCGKDYESLTCPLGFKRCDACTYAWHNHPTEQMKKEIERIRDKEEKLRK